MVFLTVLLASALVLPARAEKPVTTPKEEFGFNIGDDYCLANYTQLANYWHKLDRESDRIKVVDFGTSEEGRRMVMGIITSVSNQRRLAKFQQIARKLALAEELTDKEARALAAEGKAIVWIDGGLHASETLGSQQLIETVYQLVSGKDAETQRFLDDCIVLAIPCNPDGIELVGNWYMREQDPRKRSLTGLPRLYQKYIGHDDNRDFFAVTQSETKAMNHVMYREWFPQIVYNHHQSGPPGTVLFCPPFRDPFNYNVDPMVINGVDMVGANMINRFLVEGKPGATIRSGSRYSTWWNGGLRTTCYFHNMIGLLTESIGSPTPTSIPLNLNQQLPRADLLSPIAPQIWHFRQSIDYSVTANRSVLDFASKHRNELLYNIYQMGRRAIGRAEGDSWTVSPRRVEQAKEARRDGELRSAAQSDYKRLFQSPETRDPRAYILPANQTDFLTATKFVNTLIETGIKVHRATHDFEVAGQAYPAGSYVISCAQAFRAHVIDMFEPQDHPNDFPYPGGPPTPPYDIAGWTLAFQMGLKFDRIFDDVTAMLEELKDTVPPPAGKVTPGSAGYFLSTQVNDTFRAVNRLLAQNIPVLRLTQGFTNESKAYPPGTFFVPATNNVPAYALARELGVTFESASTPPIAMEPLHPLRIGLWDRYGGSIPSGWTRWLLEKFEYPYQLVFPPTLDGGNLRANFDVLIFVDGAIPARTNATSRTGTARATRAAEAPAGGDQPGAENDANVQNIPAEYSGRRGLITATRTIPQLRKFMEEGGTVLAIGSSTSLAAHLGLPLSNKLVEKGKDGRETALPREKYYIPGSVLRTHIDTGHPLAYGLGEDLDVMFSNSPTFRVKPGADTHGLTTIGWFNSPTPLRSGWAWGQQYLDDGITIVEASVGKGRVVLYGPEIAFRAQPHGSFKLLFNGILRANTPSSDLAQPLAAAPGAEIKTQAPQE